MAISLGIGRSEAFGGVFMKTADTSTKKEKKELTSTQQKVKVALNWTVNIACVILIIFALIVAIFTIVRSTNSDNITKFGNNCYFNVMSDSMSPVFTENDVIIADYYEGDGSDLQVGQVITFKASIPIKGTLYESFNTHRIIKINKSGDVVTEIITRGDNQPGTWQEVKDDQKKWGNYEKVLPSNVVATWGSVDKEGSFTPGRMLKGCGAFSNWLQDPESGKTNFFCVVVLPLILLFVIYAFILVRTLIIAKLENNKKVVGETAVTVDSLSDAEKRRLAEEYLASLQAAPAETPSDVVEGEEAPAENAEDKPSEEIEAQADEAEASESEDSSKTEEDGSEAPSADASSEEEKVEDDAE